ncbi:hypothetical protein [Chitinophaga tropicalis]|uniref:Uncharacterized protein n=1 Tax=Chitinophaga tropicalis TaxID=2683588 RepID=A0A7K1TZ73_9BACT|nr:hypothetical protein [Chitinophaga tropicalis]MVT07340.1 hypothetical protein [Chitinophaga tropicalis]
MCIDAENEKEILRFLKEDPARIKKFRQIVNLLIEGIRNTELYDKEDIDSGCKDVTAMKMFKKGQNIRLYCKEQKGPLGTYYIIVSELLKKKKSQKNGNTEKTLIKKVSNYDYEIKERPEE